MSVVDFHVKPAHGCDSQWRERSLSAEALLGLPRQRKTNE